VLFDRRKKFKENQPISATIAFPISISPISMLSQDDAPVDPLTSNKLENVPKGSLSTLIPKKSGLSGLDGPLELLPSPDKYHLQSNGPINGNDSHLSPSDGIDSTQSKLLFHI
jgi:hypothetical protein